MTDAELSALTALVNHETVIIDAINQQRLQDNYSVAYDDYSENWYILEAELLKRKIIGVKP